MADVDWEAVETVNVQPDFVPPVSYVNSVSIISTLCKHGGFSDK